MSRSVELDLPVGWPAPVRSFVVDVAASLHEPLEHWSGAGVLSEREDEFRQLFRGLSVRAFHATRLLPHEIERIRKEGLLMLTEELVRDRIRDVTSRNIISVALAEDLKVGHVFATNEFSNRHNQICFFLSTNVLRDQVGGVWNLMRYWGGEALSFSSRSLDFKQHLERVGAPAVVVADLDLSEPHETHAVWPGLLRAFVGRYLGEREAGGDVFYRRDVEGSRIVEVWAPGHPRYDSFKELPR